MSVAWTNGCWANNSWLGINAGPPNAWRGATTPVVSVDTHDGIREDEERRKKWQGDQEKRSSLREFLREKLDGPSPSPVVANVVKQFIAKQQTDSVEKSVYERLQVERVMANRKAVQRIERLMDEEDDDITDMVLMRFYR